MKTLVKRSFLFIVIMCLVLIPVPIYNVYGNTSVLIHFHRPDGDYDIWNIWAWAYGMEGAVFNWSGESDYGVYAEVNITSATEQVGFIVRTDGWVKDVEPDRFIDLTIGNEIWVISEQFDFTYEPPEGFLRETRPIDNLGLIIHYHRYDNFYSALQAWAEVSGTDISATPIGTQANDFGMEIHFSLSGLNTGNRIIVDVRTAISEAERITIFLNGLEPEQDTMEVFFVGGSREVPGKDMEVFNAKKSMFDASFVNSNTINVSLHYPINAKTMASKNYGFSLWDNVNGENIPVQSANALNTGGNDEVYGKLSPDYATRFELGFASSLPFGNQLELTRDTSPGIKVFIGGLYDDPLFDDMFFYDGDDLGAVWSHNSTRFRLWAPAASSAELILMPPDSPAYNTENSEIVPMTRDVNGTWVCEVMGDINRYVYLFAATNNNERNIFVDPYAKAVGINGETGVVLNLYDTNPEGWVKGGMRVTPDSPVDAVIYEINVRDLSSHVSSGIANTGLFLGFTEQGTQSPEGEKTGLDHLLELGITHVHLLPVFSFRSLDESIVPSQDFNWGYDPLNYNAPQGTYASDPFDPAIRIKEFKEMVKALSEAGIGVIMDVVYNHTGPTADHWFHLAVPYYYHRTTASGQFSNGSACGNEIADERAMVRKYIVDSVRFWVEEYNISGFRFDLMGLHHIDTMNEIRAALDEIDPTIILYGEGWMAGPSTLPSSQAALKQNAALVDMRIGFFSDDIRDGVKGSVFSAEDPGWVAGAYGRKNEVMFGMAAAVAHPQISTSALRNSNNFWAAAPTQHITYVSSHDNRTLWDKLMSSSPWAADEDLLAMNKMAAAIVLTSQGIPFIHAGEDIARTKFGDENSYRSPDHINQIRWYTKAERRDLFEYYQGLIVLRAKTPAFRMRTAEEIRENMVFLDTPPHIISYTLSNSPDNEAIEPQTILTAFNAEAENYELLLPIAGSWSVYVDGDRAGASALYQVAGESITLLPRSSYVLVYEGDISSEPGGGFRAYAMGIIGGFLLLGAVFTCFRYWNKKRLQI